MIVEQRNAWKKIKNTNRLFLGSLCFVPFAVFCLGNLRISFSMEMNLIVSQLLFWIPIVLYFLVTRTNPLKVIPFHKISLSTICMVALFTILLIPVATWINMISMLFVENRVVSMDQMLQNNSFFSNVLLLALMPALSEEMMVRGVYFQQYKVSGILKGAVVSGIVFGMMHMNFNQFSYTLVLGIVFSLLVEATGSIFSSMIAHFIFNMQSVLVIQFQDRLLGKTEGAALQQAAQPELVQMLVSYTVVALIMGILAFSLFLWIVQHCKTTERMKQIFVSNRSEEGNKIKVITPTFVIGIVLGIGLMFLMEWMG